MAKAKKRYMVYLRVFYDYGDGHVDDGKDSRVFVGYTYAVSPKQAANFVARRNKDVPFRIVSLWGDGFAKHIYEAEEACAC